MSDTELNATPAAAPHTSQIPDYARPASGAMSRHVTAAWLCGFWALNIGTAVCFKESGTSSEVWRRVLFFLAGSACGLSSTACQMKVFARMNVNLALLIITCGSFLLVQLAFWSLYRSPLTGLQWLGVGVVLVGLGLACWGTTPAPAIEAQEGPA